MPEPLVSVVIPLFNKEDYIEETLASVVRQTYTSIELVIIDDASSDYSVDKAKNFLEKHNGRFSNVIIESRANTGQAGARNDGINLAKGDFVAFLDADDIWHSKKIELQVGFLKENPKVDLVFCNYLMMSEGGSQIRAIKLVPIRKKVEMWLLTTGFGGLLESTGLVRREHLVLNKGFASDLQMCGGLDLAFRFSSLGTAGCVDDYLCIYRVTPTGWHNNKSDLVDSYRKLFTNDVLYGRYRKVAFKNLSIHLSLWNFRHSKNLGVFSSLIATFVKSPVLFSRYFLATGNRVLLANLRGMALKRRSPNFLEWFK
jgi:glycosyltransferase involved in cell wall biosynthesis